MHLSDPTEALHALHLPASALDDLFNDIELLCLDVFDTVLVRRCLSPIDVFSWIEASSGEMGFSKDRVQAEKLARRMNRKRGDEVSLDEIYSVLGSIRDLPADAVERELRAEEHFLFASPTAVALIESARQRNIRVVAVSDIYLKSEHISRLLENCGVTVDAIYCSADYREKNLGKYNGTIFARVAELEATATDRILHLGDNPVSDYENALSSGVKAVLLSNLHALAADLNDHVNRALSNATDFTDRTIAGQLSYGFLKNRANMTTVDGYAYCYGGPLLLGMVKFMAQQASQRNISRFILLERDGNILKEALDRLGPFDFDYRLVPSSRRMSIFPLAERRGYKAISYLFEGSDRTIDETTFFKILSLERPNEVEPRTEKVSPQEHYLRHERYLLAQAERERVALERMLAEELRMAEDGKSVAWFDVGWALSSAAALNEVLRVDWPCFCIGSHSRAASDLPQVGYMFERGYPADVASSVMGAPEVIELIFSAVRPSVAYALPEGETTWTIVTSPRSVASRVRDAFVKATWHGALAFIDDVRDIVDGLSDHSLRQYNQRMFRELCSAPTRAQYEVLSFVPHNRTAGDGTWNQIGGHWKPSGSTTNSLTGPIQNMRKRKPLRDFVAYHVLSMLTRDGVPISPRTRERFQRSAAKRTPRYVGRRASAIASKPAKPSPRAIEMAGDPASSSAVSKSQSIPASFLSPRLTEDVEWAFGDRQEIDQSLLSNDLARLWLDIPDGHKWLNYFPVYERVLGGLRNRAPKILEIGVNYGASLHLWREYFGPGTEIHGIDIEPHVVKYADPEAKTFTHVGDQSDAEFLAKIVSEHGPFDLVIDDGSHVISHQIASFNALFESALRPGGLYLVEDVETSYWGDRTGQKDIDIRFTEFAYNIVDLMHQPYVDHGYDRFVYVERAKGTISVPRITTLIDEIRFFDSIVVFGRASPLPPITRNLTYE